MGGASLLRYYHTIRHLRPVQLYGRVIYAWRRPPLKTGATPTVRRLSGNWLEPAAKTMRMTGPTHFRFLNQDGQCALGADWNAPQFTKLWLYNLHYFDDLVAEGSLKRVVWHGELIHRWIVENPPTHGTGWEAYPTSLRIVNWIKWALAGRPASDEIIRSLALQTRWLMHRVEHHLLGNHLIANAKALVFSGLFFEGPEADAWRSEGLSILAHEIPLQLLDDGGHFELSPMYHALILEDLLDLINVGSSYRPLIDDATVAKWRLLAGQMLAWSRAMSHPDGEIAFFNDSAFDVAPPLVKLTAYGARLGVKEPSSPTVMTDSGYARAELGAAVLIVDVAAVGPDYQPAHAHADTLSFELSLFGQRVFVNSGTSTYAPGPQRTAERSTAAHNTVQVDGADSSEVWAAFRVARRARPRDVLIARDNQSVRIAGAHDGYRRLPGKPMHRREWRLEDGRLTIIDRIRGAFQSAVARFHLHPSVHVDSTARCLTLASGERLRWRVHGGSERVEPASWYPEFGRVVPASCLRIDFTGPALQFELEWLLE